MMYTLFREGLGGSYKSCFKGQKLRQQNTKVHNAICKKEVK